MPSGEQEGEATQDRPDRREEDGACAAVARPWRRRRTEPGTGAERGARGPQATASGAPTPGEGADIADELDQGTSDRDRGAPHGATPPTPPGIRVTYHGGSAD